MVNSLSQNVCKLFYVYTLRNKKILDCVVKFIKRNKTSYQAFVLYLKMFYEETNDCDTVIVMFIHMFIFFASLVKNSSKPVHKGYLYPIYIVEPHNGKKLEQWKYLCNINVLIKKIETGNWELITL